MPAQTADPTRTVHLRLHSQCTDMTPEPKDEEMSRFTRLLLGFMFEGGLQKLHAGCFYKFICQLNPHQVCNTQVLLVHRLCRPLSFVQQGTDMLFATVYTSLLNHVHVHLVPLWAFAHC